MNILISTTTNWNPGDDFIRYGVKNLLNSLHSDINYIHYDRNPDFFKKDKWEMGSGHKSNCMNNPIDWSIIDAVVLAGSPEFLHGPLKPLYEGLANHPEIPLLALGVGYSHSVENLTLSREEEIVLKRDNTLIITRQDDLAARLYFLLYGKIVHTLPCPALFASFKDMRGIQYNSLLIPQTCCGEQALDEEDYDETQQYHDTSTIILVHYITDFKNWPNSYFSTEARDLLLKIIEHKEVVSNRLHGGIVALGAGSKVKIINSSDRVQKALEPYAPYLNDGWYEMTLKQVNGIKIEYTNRIKEYL